jgi:two-component system alkaline phosphatase synthesis response regulator PhoP
MKKKVLIVDDNPDLLFLIKRGLEQDSKNFEVIEAENGKKCLDILKKGNIPDIILLDIMMPEMSGWDVFSHIKQNADWRNIPIVFLTAKSDNFSQGFGKLSADEYITKPFEIHFLKKHIEKVLKR